MIEYHITYLPGTEEAPITAIEEGLNNFSSISKLLFNIYDL